MKAELRILPTGTQKELLKVQQLRYVITEASGYAYLPRGDFITMITQPGKYEGDIESILDYLQIKKIPPS